MKKRDNSLAPVSDSIRKIMARAEFEQAKNKSFNRTADKSHTTTNSLQHPPKGDEQPDFFVPSVYDLGIRDNFSLMDVAAFRLSKREKRAGEVIRYKISNHEYVEVKSGPDGMATIWDYDIVLMMVSHLTEAMNRYRDGKGEKPGRMFTPHASDILKFCRKGDGSRQLTEVEAALDRLRGTTIKSVREVSRDGKTITREVESESLISHYHIKSFTSTGKMAIVEIEVPSWIYRDVTEGKQPEVLTMHPDYFLIKRSWGRLIYRLARRAAGIKPARWRFRLIYERSGSTSTFNKFCFSLRELIATDNLPEFTLQEEAGKDGPILVMKRRNAPAELPKDSQ